MKKYKSWFKKCILLLILIYFTFSCIIPVISSKDDNNTKDYNSTDLSCYEIENQPPEALNQLELWINMKTYRVNRQEKVADVSPIIKDGRTLVPIRVVSEGLGADIKWNAAERKVYINQEVLEGVEQVVLAIGDKNFYVNGIQKQMEVPPQIINNRTMVPIRAVSETLGCKVYWDSKEKKVTVKSLNLNSDVDKDGLSLKEEYIFGTNPNEKDDLQIYKACGEPNSDEAFEEGTPFKADVSGDLKIDKTDFDLVKSLKGSTPKDTFWNYKCDIDGNKIIDGKDLLAVYVNMGREYKFSNLLNDLGSAEIKDNFVRYILSKIIASGKDIESSDLENYLDLLVNNRDKGEKIEYLVHTGFSWEDGVQSNLEKQIISQYLEGTIDKNIIRQLQEFYLGEMEKRFPGIENEVLNIPEFDSSFESLEALEDIYGQVIRSEPYEKYDDRFDPLKITRGKEIWEALDLILKGGHLYDERKPNKEKVFSIAKTLKIDGGEDDWNEIKDYTYLISDFKGDQDEKALDLTFLRYTMDEEYLYFLFKTLANPSESKDVQYFIHMDDGKQLGGMNEFSINFDPDTKEAGLYNNETQHYYPVEAAINDVVEIKIPLKYFGTEDPTTLGLMDAGIYLISTHDFADQIQCNVIIGDLLQDFSYDIAKHNFQLQGLFQLCLDNELCEKDTTAFAISMVDSLYRAMGDEEVQSQVRLDDNEMLIFSRELQKFCKQQDIAWDFNAYPLEAKIAWAWRGCHTVTHGAYRLINRYLARDCELDNFIDRTKERLTLYEYQWNNVKIDTLREMQKEILTKGWISNTPSKTASIVRAKFIKGYPNPEYIWIETSTLAGACEKKEIYKGKAYTSAGLDSANFEWYRYKKYGAGIGQCEDSQVFSEALLKSVGIPTLPVYWRVISGVKDINTGKIVDYNSDGHAIPMFYDVTINRWKFDSLDSNHGKELFKEDGYFEACIFTPPLKLQGYLQKLDPTETGSPPKAQRDFRVDNNAWKQFYNLSYSTFRTFLSGGLSDIGIKKILEKYDFVLRY
jgi:hypothetical protein